MGRGFPYPPTLPRRFHLFAQVGNQRDAPAIGRTESNSRTASGSVCDSRTVTTTTDSPTPQMMCVSRRGRFSFPSLVSASFCFPSPSLATSNPFVGAGDSLRLAHPDGGREYMPRNVRQRERFTDHAHAMVVVVEALLAFLIQGGDVHGNRSLAFRSRKADLYRNFSQLRLGDPKGLPSFFALMMIGSSCRDESLTVALAVRQPLGENLAKVVFSLDGGQTRLGLRLAKCPSLCQACRCRRFRQRGKPLQEHDTRLQG